MSWLSNLFSKKKEDDKLNQKTFAKWADSLEKLADTQAKMLDIMIQGKVLEGNDIPDTPKFSVKCVLTNNTLMAILNDGEIFSCVGDQVLFNSVSNATSKEQVRTLMYPEVVEHETKIAIVEEERKKAVKESIDKENKQILKEVAENEKVKQHVINLTNSGEFELKDEVLYMKGIPLGIPNLLVKQFVKLVDKVYNGTPDKIEEYEQEYKALKNFWMWCSLCPNPQSREDMFKFLQKHDFKINKHGMFFAYRMVNSVASSKKDSHSYAESISTLKTQVKLWKKSASNFEVFQDLDSKDFFTLQNGKTINVKLHKQYKLIGNLQELYNSLSDESVTEQLYTDAYTGTMDIRIGKAVSMDRYECDDDHNQDCSKGLHVGNKSFAFSGNGDTSILVLINPMNAVSIPHYDSNKMRVCEYYPVSIIPGTEKDMKKYLEDKNVMELGDEYFLNQMNNLESMVKKNTPQELGTKKLVSPEQTKASLKVIETAFASEVATVKANKVDAKAAIINRVKKA